MRDHRLRPTQRGYSNQYNFRVGPTVSNIFSTAAFRFGHGMIPDIHSVKGQTKGKGGFDANGLVFGLSFVAYE